MGAVRLADRRADQVQVAPAASMAANNNRLGPIILKTTSNTMNAEASYRATTDQGRKRSRPEPATCT